eukprot:7159125-Prymnesium_polylepis.2
MARAARPHAPTWPLTQAAPPLALSRRPTRLARCLAAFPASRSAVQRSFDGSGGDALDVCSCSTPPETVYALAVDEAVLSFHHSFATEEFSQMRGTSR